MPTQRAMELGLGSSPLTRGAHWVACQCPAVCGLIPAHAGSTHEQGHDPVLCGAHPRSRGEHQLGGSACSYLFGSSPLTRGAPQSLRRSFRLLGLIPAHAGSTTKRCLLSTAVRAHPRSRGEHSSPSSGSGCLRGSSPLTRGARLRRMLRPPRLRLIPARAGSTPVLRGQATAPRAHPRSRGEHGVSSPRFAPAGGSSPLTRGALRGDNVHFIHRGLIPAHAGSTCRKILWLLSPLAHPRSRGEHATEGVGLADRVGSPPLTRGARGLRRVVLGGRRLIPAHAGSTALGGMDGGGSRAHPRSRGEHG